MEIVILLSAAAVFSIYLFGDSIKKLQRPPPPRQKREEEEEEDRVVYFVPKVGKTGSSTLRQVFDDRGKFYGSSRMDDQAVASDIRRKCSGGGADASTTHYPFFSTEKIPYFWALADTIDRECLVNVIDSAWKFRRGSGGGRSSSSSAAAGGRHDNPKPVVQTTVRKSKLCLKTADANGGVGSNKNKKVKCRRLLQLRDPLAWVFSSFDFWCWHCQDNKRFCGNVVDAKCGPEHRQSGDHETLQSWARKFGNVFTRVLLFDEDDDDDGSRMLAGGFHGEHLSPDGWMYPDILKEDQQSRRRRVNEILRRVKEDGDCLVALEDPHRMSKIESCLGDPPGFYGEALNVTAGTAVNKRPKEKKDKMTKKLLDPNVTAELREILEPDILLYNALFPFLAKADDDDVNE